MYVFNIDDPSFFFTLTMSFVHVCVVSIIPNLRIDSCELYHNNMDTAVISLSQSL